MFVENNDRISFAELESRLVLEVSRFFRLSPASMGGVESSPTAPQLATETAILDATGDNAMTVEPRTRPSLWDRISLLGWGVIHIRTVLRRVTLGVYAAEDARDRVGRAETRIQGLADQADARSAELGEQLRTYAAALSEQVATWASMTESLSRRLALTTSDLSAETQARQSLKAEMKALRAELLFQQRRLTQLASPTVSLPVEVPVAPTIVSQRFDSLYAAYEDVFRGSREDIKNRLLQYRDRVVLAGAGQPGKPIIDIGCGRGEWLELLKEMGLHAYGIDVNTIMVERCTALGLDARHADALAHLRSIPDADRSALTTFHVIEHLPFEVLVDFLDEAFRVLMPGGLLILETPNPETMRVGATTFYNDPTHRNPLMPEPLHFIVAHRGFVETEILRLHPFTEGLLVEKTNDAAMLNRVLFGPQDYAIIARRP